MTVQMRRCRACGAEVVWLPSGRGLGGWVLVEPRESATADVPEDQQWAWRRGVGLVALRHEAHKPARCMVRHRCDYFRASGVKGVDRDGDQW
jgi:Family of unknown function (DUF6083)